MNSHNRRNMDNYIYYFAFDDFVQVRGQLFEYFICHAISTEKYTFKVFQICLPKGPFIVSVCVWDFFFWCLAFFNVNSTTNINGTHLLVTSQSR